MHPPDHSAALIVKAVAFAANKHRRQRRKDMNQSPYIGHPIELANVLANEGGITDTNVLCAALLHDTIEDTDTTTKELEVNFGLKIAGIVLEVTDDKSLDKQTRKELQIEHAPRCSPEAKLVKLADKICNLRDILTSPPSDWPAERKRDYFDWAARVIDGIRGQNVALEAVFDDLYRRKIELQ